MKGPEKRGTRVVSGVQASGEMGAGGMGWCQRRAWSWNSALKTGGEGRFPGPLDVGCPCSVSCRLPGAQALRNDQRHRARQLLCVFNLLQAGPPHPTLPPAPRPWRPRTLIPSPGTKAPGGLQQAGQTKTHRADTEDGRRQAWWVRGRGEAPTGSGCVPAAGSPGRPGCGGVSGAVDAALTCHPCATGTAGGRRKSA